jgi:translocation and assembly module TamB
MRVLRILALCLLATPAIAQDEPGFFSRLFGTDEAATDEDQGGVLERFIEDNLSGEGRQVSITGFTGALSGRATLETMTISDADGAWLTLTDVVLDWNRSALFRGRLEVAELSAAEILLPRLPLPAEVAAPTPEASGFKLPELPVSVLLEKIAAERVEIGAPVFGAEVIASVAGSLSLDGGEGGANLEIAKLTGDGALSLEAAYSNATEVLALDLALSEDADGILARLTDLPGRPSIDFSIEGEAPITAYAADIRLATDGQERLTGRIETEQPQGAEDGTLQIAVAIDGDIAPLFNAEYQPFFGPEVGLSATLTRFEDGRMTVDGLEVTSRALSLTGALSIGSDGLPRDITLTGAIASGNGPVLLPLPGPETRVDRVDLTVSFDADRGDIWTGEFSIDGLDRPGFSAAAIELNGDGRIVTGTAPQISARLDFEASNLDLGDPDAAQALGEAVRGGVSIDWTSDQPLRLTDLVVEGETYGLDGRAEIAFGDSGPVIDGRARVLADRLSVFSGVAGRQLGGSAALFADFNVTPLAGYFDVTATGTTDDLVVSQPEADRILAGEARLDITASRDETGVRVRLDTLESPNASLTGQATLKSGGSSLSLSGALEDAALVLPQISGPVRLTIQAEEDADRIWAWSADTALEDTRLTAKGTLVDLYRNPIVAATGRLEAADLRYFAGLANRPLSGAVETDFAGEVSSDLSRANMNLTGTATDLRIGQPQADALLAGPVEFAIDAAMAGEVFTLRNSTIDGPQITLSADGTLVPEASRFELEGRIADAALVLTGAPSAPLSFAANARQDGRDWAFDANANGPDLELAATGTALDPLGDPAVDGRISLTAGDLSQFSDLAKRSLSGRLSLEAEGRVTADLQRFDVTANASGAGLSIGQAEADRLLAGDLQLDVTASRTDGTLDIDSLSLSTGLLNLSANGALGSDGGSMTLDARLADIASFVDGFSGPVTATGSVAQQPDGSLSVDLSGTGPGGTAATVTGTAAGDFANVNLDVDGTAPLGLLNRFVAPRSLAGIAGFDLTVNGPPALSSVAGTVTASNARLVAPALGITLDNIAINSSLEAGRANLSLTAGVENGGQVSVNGPLTLSPPFNADLTVALNSVVLTDPRLYETIVDGRIAISGPLTGGASITGDLALGETNIRIPSSGLGGAGAVPEIIHINEPPPVRGTRRRAGLLEQSGGNGKSGPVYPLNIRVAAPNRIFVRGRGLDSEFGGNLQITGTSAEIVPVGAFNLIRGRLDILGQRLALEEAAITMQGSFLPIVRIRATTQAEEYTIAVIVAGPVSDPEITFTSEPDLPQEEVLARLIFGRGLDTLSPIQAARLALAVRTLAGRGGEGVVGNIRQGAGLADLDLTTDEEGNAAVRAGAYLGENIYTDVTIGASGETELNLNLDVSRSVTVKGSVTNEGDTSIGVFFERDY